MGRIKKCFYGPCQSSEGAKRTGTHVSFIKFPSPKRDLIKCRKWVTACGRPDLSITNITGSSYICSRHFVGFQGPTTENPDPINLTEVFNSVKATVNAKQAALGIGLDISKLTPVNGFALETFENTTATYCKHIRGYKSLQCSFTSSPEVHVKIEVLDSNVSLDKIEPDFRLETNNDVYKLLNTLNQYKCCEGNADEKFLELHLKSKVTKHVKRSYYCPKIKTIFSNNCHRLIFSSVKRCPACNVHRSTLRQLALRQRNKATTKKVQERVKKTTSKKLRTQSLVSKAKKQSLQREKNDKQIKAMSAILQEHLDREPPESFMSVYLKDQLAALKTSKYRMRWSLKVLKQCAYLKNKSKATYLALKKSKTVFLPAIQ